MPAGAHLLVDISNSFTKLGLSDGDQLLEKTRVPTSDLGPTSVPPDWQYQSIAISSVVPSATQRILQPGIPTLQVIPEIDLGIGIDYPEPDTIGGDRLCNAVACVLLHGCPAIIVDAGTAVTFDIVSADKAYIGGVIAPGLSLMTDYLHERTALLPKIDLEIPRRAVGKSTTEAMRSGAYHGYRGLIHELTRVITQEEFPDRRPLVIATGGDAELIARGNSLFNAVDPDLTLHGLRILAVRNL